MKKAAAAVWTFLDGWKLPIGVIALLGAKTWDGLHNGHAGDVVGLLLTYFGWSPGVDVDYAQAASAVIILLGIGHKVVKAKRQRKAGSSVSGLLSTEGAVQEYIDKAQKQG